ncbi:hypothetical protein [Desulfogranum marinum]|uniref:hypothetical protein n=1 Tax=Desulfogranum marinum TaxID=453220 RepID=UPI0029C7F540|nr:hypothetical protein [Desulfogranum marinum]
MNLDCAGRPLTEILDEVADFFETELVYQAEESGLAIQCSYSQATVSEILNRLFQAQSRAILIENLPERRITVEVFGLSERHVVSTGEGSGKETLPFLGGMTKAELAAMQHAQLELYHQEMKNPSAIIPGLSITRGELEYLHREQNLGYRKLVGDPNQRVAGMSMTLQELEESHEQQLLRYEEKKWSQDVKDPLTGLIPAEIKELHQRQIEASRLE